MTDKFLILFGTIFGGRSRAYGRVDQSRLPDGVRALLQSYKQVVISLCVACVLPLFFLRPLTVLLAAPLIGLTFLLKIKFEQKLDPLLAPYIPPEQP